MFRKEVLANGLTVLTEKMPHVRSVAVGVWIRRGSRHEAKARERPRPFPRAHGLQGHGAEKPGRDRPGNGRDWGADGRLHLSGIRGVPREGARRARGEGDRPSLGHRLSTPVRRGRNRAGAQGHPRRDEERRGHSRRRGARHFQRSVLAGPRARAPGARPDRDRLELRAEGPPPVLQEDVYPVQSDRLRRGKPGNGPYPRPGAGAILLPLDASRRARGCRAHGFPLDSTRREGPGARSPRRRLRRAASGVRQPPRRLRHERRPRRQSELAALPGHPGTARTRVRGVLEPLPHITTPACSRSTRAPSHRTFRSRST